MLLFLVVYLLLLLLVILSYISWEKNKYFILISNVSCIIFLICFCGFRLPGISNDDINYMNAYYYGDFDFEFAFSKLSSILKNINVDYTGYFLVLSIISLSIFFYSLFRFNNRLMSFSLLIYISHVFFYRDLIQVRAAISYNLILLSLIFLLNGKAIRYLFCSLFSIGFHKTSIVCLASSYFLDRYRIHIKSSILISILGGLYVLSFLGVNKYVNDIILLPMNILGISGKTYLASESSQFSYSLSFYNPTTIKLLIYFGIFTYYRDKLFLIFKSDVFYYLYFISCFIILFFSNYAVFASRFSSSFSLIEFLLIPSLVYYLKNNILFLFFISTTILQFILNFYFKGFYYQSIF